MLRGFREWAAQRTVRDALRTVVAPGSLEFPGRQANPRVLAVGRIAPQHRHPNLPCSTSHVQTIGAEGNLTVQMGNHGFDLKRLPKTGIAPIIAPHGIQVVA